MDKGEGKEVAVPPKAEGRITRKGRATARSLSPSSLPGSSSDVTTSTEVSKGKGVNTFTLGPLLSAVHCPLPAHTSNLHTRTRGRSAAIAPRLTFFWVLYLFCNLFDRS